MPMIINNQRIELDELQGEVGRLMQQAGQQEPNDQLMGQAQQNIIARTLLQQQVDQENITLDDDALSEAVVEFYEENGGKETFLQNSQLTEEDEPRIAEHVSSNLKIEKLLDQYVPQLPVPTPEAMQQHYEQNTENYILPPRVRVSQIVRHPTGPDDEVTFNKMVRIRKRLLAGEDFATVADENTQCSNEPGGDLGEVGKGQMVEPFELIVFSQEIDEISPVFVTQFGYHITKVTEQHEARQMDFDEVKDDIQEELSNQQEHESIQKYIESLIEKATIEQVEDTPEDTPENTPKK